MTQTGEGPEAMHAVAARGIEGPGGELPHLGTIQRLFGRHNVSSVSSHVGGLAEEACHEMRAHAYASGTDVAFSGAPDLHTAAHEAAHVVQQRAGVQLKGGVGSPCDEHERHADAVADRVTAGWPAESMLDAYTSSPAGSPAIQSKHSEATVQLDSKKTAQPPTKQQDSSRVARLIELLTTTPPVSSVGDYDDAFAFLSALSMPDLLATMSGAADRGYLPQLVERSSSAAAYDGARLMSALYAVELARTAPSSIDNERLNRAGVQLDQIPREQQLQVFEYLLNRRGVSISVTTLLEGVIAARAQGSTADHAADGDRAGADSAAPGDAAGTRGTGVNPAAAGGPVAAATGVPPQIGPGPWSPPGDQPIALYIGNQAHKGIAAEYQAAHPGDVVRSNAFPLSSILRTLTQMGHTADPGALGDTELLLAPDIANLTRLHLYEIKPLAAAHK